MYHLNDVNRSHLEYKICLPDGEHSGQRETEDYGDLLDLSGQLFSPQLDFAETGWIPKPCSHSTSNHTLYDRTETWLASYVQNKKKTTLRKIVSIYN